jgi:hypothetical protein
MEIHLDLGPPRVEERQGFRSEANADAACVRRLPFEVEDGVVILLLDSESTGGARMSRYPTLDGGRDSNMRARSPDSQAPGIADSSSSL